jgi:circadian clock protein KaiC
MLRCLGLVYDYNYQDSKISTGIVGLDAILFGGIPKNNQVLLTGPAGTGKTLLSFEILYRNAKEKRPCTFITFDEHRASLLENVKGAFSDFDDIEELIAKNIMTVSEHRLLEAYGTRENFEAFISGLNKTIRLNNSQIVVIDSISPIRPLFDDDRIVTRAINFLAENFKNLGVTAFFTHEVYNASNIIDDLLGTYMFDGLIKLNTLGEEGSFQFLTRVVKMRGTDHSNVSMPYEITPNGINIFR